MFEIPMQLKDRGLDLIYISSFVSEKTWDIFVKRSNVFQKSFDVFSETIAAFWENKKPYPKRIRLSFYL